MLCLQCKNETFRECMTDTAQVFRDENFTVKAPAMACKQCGWLTMTDAQADLLSLKVAEAYRKKHELLTSADIIETRNRFGLSQKAFAQRLSVGVASLKRWETGFVQEKSSDTLIRMKVNQMMEASGFRPALAEWFAEQSMPTAVTLSGVGLQLSPKTEPVNPKWRNPGAVRKPARPLPRTRKYDPDFTVAA